MCEDCGCQIHNGEPKRVTINRSVTEVNDILADQIARSLQQKQILCVNIMGAPGSGKTTVIEGVLNFLEVSSVAVIQGDLESDIDKKRLEKRKIETVQINTHSGCHLNSSMVHTALLDLDLKNKRFLFIENVGNLVCPAGVRIGQHINMVVSSTPEGSDKPKKYPYIFLDAHVVVISKYDLAEIVGFDEEQYIDDIKKINRKICFVKTSWKNTESFREVVQFLEHERDHLLGHHHGHTDI
ncbi:MAG: hydrogenase nickel incorporation protein HypB [Candidatus Thermoplasmatota archaeon]